MVVLGLNDLALVLFNFGGRALQDLHIDNVVAAVDAIGRVTTNQHAYLFWNSLSRHIANTRPAQIVKLQPDVLCLFLRFARCASASFREVRAAISTFKPTKPSADARIPPCLPEIFNRTSVVVCKHKIVRLLASNTAHYNLEDVLRQGRSAPRFCGALTQTGAASMRT